MPKNSFNWTPGERKRIGFMLLAAAAVLLLVAILFLRAGAMAKKEPKSSPTPTVSASAPPQDEPPLEPSPSTVPDVSPSPTVDVIPSSPSPTIDLYGQLDFRPSTMFQTPEAYIVNSPDGNLNIRRGPSTAYEKLGSFDSGIQVTVYTIESGWALVLYGQQYAWVSANYLVYPEE